MNIVYCNECIIEFEIKLKTEKVYLDIEKTYFICPHCGFEYVAFYTNKKIRNKQKKIRVLARDPGKQKEYIKLYEEIEKLMKDLKKQMEGHEGNEI